MEQIWNNSPDDHFSQRFKNKNVLEKYGGTSFNSNFHGDWELIDIRNGAYQGISHGRGVRISWQNNLIPEKISITNNKISIFEGVNPKNPINPVGSITKEIKIDKATLVEVVKNVAGLRDDDPDDIILAAVKGQNIPGLTINSDDSASLTITLDNKVTRSAQNSINLNATITSPDYISNLKLNITIQITIMNNRPTTSTGTTSTGTTSTRAITTTTPPPYLMVQINWTDLSDSTGEALETMIRLYKRPKRPTANKKMTLKMILIIIFSSLGGVGLIAFLIWRFSVK